MLVAAVAISVERCAARRGASIPRPTAFDLPSLATYWNTARAAIGEDIALQVAGDILIGHLGLEGLVITSAATLREAIDTLSERYLPRLIPGMRLSIVAVDRDQSELRLDWETDEHATTTSLLDEFTLATLHHHFDMAIQRPTVTAVAFRRAAPSSPDAWREYFGVEPQFAQRQTVLRMMTADLALPLRTANPNLRTLAPTAVPESLVDRVRTYVRDRLREQIDPEILAKELGLTGRTMQRKLQAEGTSLRDIVAAMRIEVASDMLKRTETAISEIALAVGFAQPASFARAFVQATGDTPQAFRRKHT